MNAVQYEGKGANDHEENTKDDEEEDPEVR